MHVSLGCYRCAYYRSLQRVRTSKSGEALTENHYSDVQKSVPVKLASLLPYIAIRYCFDSHPRIDSVRQKPLYRYGLLENAIYGIALISVQGKTADVSTAIH